MSMTVKEAIRQIRIPGPVYVWTRLFDNGDDGRYVEARKDNLIACLQEQDWATASVNAVRRDDALYID